MIDKYPLPWTFDYFPHKIPKYNKARIYAQNSTPISETSGEHAEQLAQTIVNAMNNKAQDRAAWKKEVLGDWQVKTKENHECR